MRVQLAGFIRDTAQGDEAQDILQRCVHCGFCLATCPTYQVLGDELDSPRGRIYLIKQMLEGTPVTARTREHLDRCLSCHACETTCPSGVDYGHLLDIGRKEALAQAPRSAPATALRSLLRETLTRPGVFRRVLDVGRLAAPLLPRSLRAKLPEPAGGAWPAPRHARRMLVLGGCVQPVMRPAINLAAARVLDAIGISLVELTGQCCGALRFHTDDMAGGRADARTLAAQAATAGHEAFVMTASGCGAFVRDYAHLLPDDPAAAELAGHTRDIAEVLLQEIDRLLPRVAGRAAGRSLAWHSPCTLQHWQGIKGGVERLLEGAGYRLTPVADSHLCCGSAGAYSLLQPTLAGALRRRKLDALQAGVPSGIASANIGCITHLAGDTNLPVRHWIEWLADCLPT
ncbi:glycolate oxidase subunit GlcF [Uliginosibacterium sp. H1]|uniref:glycolate oxidase subunit GlcF n=1 Tax=Uliginosibacterium sp. H1 TaxID=3114757 RepID=UPI002E19D38C|nr:glycolate oxidase subunit GlcF [Uliginosibacterium sp. H1]